MGEFITAHFLTDQTGKSCGDFTFSETDLKLASTKEINLNDQPAQIILSHPKVPGLSWMFFFYQTGHNQYQPKIAFDFPSYLRADCEVCIRLGGMHWAVKHKFEGSAWLSTCLPPQIINERWVTLGTCKKVEININMTKIWFKFPVFSVCCHAIKTKKVYSIPDFTNPSQHSDIQLNPIDQGLGRRLFAHSQILSLNSHWFADRVTNQVATKCGDTMPSLSIPFSFEATYNFLCCLYPNSHFVIDEGNVEALMDMAREYDVPQVKRRCEKFLFKNLEAGSCILSFYMSRKHDLPQLQEAAVLHLSEMNVSQLRSRVSLDMKLKTPEIQEILLNDLYARLANTHM